MTYIAKLGFKIDSSPLVRAGQHAQKAAEQIGALGPGAAAAASGIGTLATAFLGAQAALASVQDKWAKYEGQLKSTLGSTVAARQAISDLYDQAYRYRRIMMKQFTDPDRFIASHERLAERVLNRGFDEARAELLLHIHSTLKYVYPETGTP